MLKFSLAILVEPQLWQTADQPKLTLPQVVMSSAFLPHCSWAHARSLSLACLCVSVCIEVRVRFGPLPWEHARLGAGATCAGIVLRVFFSARTALNPRNECAADLGVFPRLPRNNQRSEWPVTRYFFVFVPSKKALVLQILEQFLIKGLPLVDQ